MPVHRRAVRQRQRRFGPQLFDAEFRAMDLPRRTNSRTCARAVCNPTATARPRTCTGVRGFSRNNAMTARRTACAMCKHRTRRTECVVRASRRRRRRRRHPSEIDVIGHSYFDRLTVQQCLGVAPFAHGRNRRTGEVRMRLAQDADVGDVAIEPDAPLRSRLPVGAGAAQLGRIGRSDIPHLLRRHDLSSRA